MEKRGRPLQEGSGPQTRDSQPRCGHLKPIKVMDYFRILAGMSLSLIMVIFSQTSHLSQERIELGVILGCPECGLFSYLRARIWFFSWIVCYLSQII